MISEILATVLQSGRTEFNARHESARQRYPALDGEALTKFITETIDPLAQGAARVSRDQVEEVVTVAYDIGLELVGQRLTGNETRGRTVDAAWHKISSSLMPLITAAPERLLPAIYNALHTLTTTPGARAGQWADELARLGASAAGPDQLLKLGQVLGWRAGLAHYRTGALAVAATLPPTLALAAVGADANQNWTDVAQRLENDPWFDPAKGEAKAERSRIAVVAKMGGFRGFGGLFVEPPQVASSRDQLWVKSGNDCWLLCADGFGYTFHRAAVEEFESARENSFNPGGLFVFSGNVTWHDRSLGLPASVEVSSSATTATTVAITSPGTFAVTLIAVV